MVGAPKNLSDLAKIEAALHVRCRACGRERLYDRNLLAADLSRRGWNTSWEMLPRALPCRCGSSNVSVRPAPYTRQVRDPCLRPYQARLIEIAVAVLTDAEARAASGELAIRLALRVLLPWVEHRHILEDVWRLTEIANPLVRRDSWRGSMSELRNELRMLGRLKRGEVANDR